jgi:dsRNA-specific ribonuclease
MDRKLKFESLAQHPWLHKAFKKLKAEELAMARAFLAENEALDQGAFELKINRMFLDKPKPRNFTIILELLCNSNIERSPK